LVVPDPGPSLPRPGAGVKIKVVESMARGLPVVTTSVGAQGLDVVSGEHLLIADRPDEFTRQVVELIRDPERDGRVGRAARDYISAHCSPETTAARTGGVLGSSTRRITATSV
jgi:glycosyltransferase involved in cell wall biosynthesis